MCLAAVYWAGIGELYYGCTRQDAAEIGFQDNDLYEVFSGKTDSSRLTMKQIGREECLKAFTAWQGKSDKILYRYHSFVFFIVFIRSSTIPHPDSPHAHNLRPRYVFQDARVCGIGHKNDGFGGVLQHECHLGIVQQRGIYLRGDTN